MSPEQQPWVDPAAQQPYGQQPYGQQPYGQPYGQQPYGQPAPGWQQPAWQPEPSWQPQPPQTWPYGPGRPGQATAAAVLGIVTGSLTLIGGLVFLVAGLTGDGDVATWLLALGVPLGVVLLVGGIGLLSRRQVGLVLWTAVGAAVLLVVALLGGVLDHRGDSDAIDAMLGFTLFALPLPIVTASLSAQRTVREWVLAGHFGG